MLIRKTVVPAALFLALAAGCANNAPIESGGAPAPASSSSGAITEPSTAPASTSASPEPGSVTLSGTVTAGVEPNCLLLKDGTGDHLLIVKDEKLRATIREGAKITVVGKAQSGVMTTCMQGQPFEVSSVTVN